MNDLEKFYKLYVPYQKQFLQSKEPGKRNRKAKISNIKILAIMILWHLTGAGNFKAFYTFYVPKICRKIPEYSWFMRLRERVFQDLFYFIQYKCVSTGNCFYIDSTPIKVCHNKRIRQHKTFKKLAARGKHSMGWFYGFKLHLIINEKSELVKFAFTKGNVADVHAIKMAEELHGTLVGDRGYISQQWSEYLEKRGLKLVTTIRKNMTKPMLTSTEEALLRKRNIIETVFSRLKNWGLVYTKIRSYCGWILNALSTLATLVIHYPKPPITSPKIFLIRN